MNDLTPEPPSDLPSAALERLASRVATAGIIAGLALTAAGMLLRSPLAGGAGLAILAALVLFRHPIAKLVARVRP